MLASATAFGLVKKIGEAADLRANVGVARRPAFPLSLAEMAGSHLAALWQCRTVGF
jgi:hypothetical protein